MQWSLETSDALAALRTLMLNGGWERYWQQRQVSRWSQVDPALIRAYTKTRLERPNKGMVI
jgi:hypothetical protein